MNSLLFEQGRLRERWQRALGEVNSLLLGGAESAEAFQLIARRACEVSGSDTALILLADESGEALSVAAGAGSRGEEMVGRRITATAPAIAAVVADREPAVYGDFAEALGSEAGLFGDFGPADVVPFVSAAGIRGLLLALRNKGGHRFGPEQLPMLASFATQAALALELAD